MNCKPGDLAVVIRPTKGGPQLLGMIVTVLHAAPVHDFRLPDGHMQESGCTGYWVIEFQRQIQVPTNYGSRMARYGSAPDSHLRPILDNDGEDETLTWADKPEGVTA